jgi:hypothetical protein
VPVRDVSLPPATGPRPAKRLLTLTVAFALTLTAGIVIGTRLGSTGAPSRQVVIERAAPGTGADQALGRRAPAASAHTRAGAVASAARSITAFGGNVLLEPSRLRALVARIASNGSRTRLIDAFAEASSQTRTKLGADTVPRPVIVLRAAPVGYRVERYSQLAATIAVWYVCVVGSGATVQPQQSWRTETVELVWERGAWKVDSFASTVGPTPALTASDSEPSGELFTTIPSFREFGYGAR